MIPYKGNVEWLNTQTIFLTLHGSHAYGLNTAESDKDYKGICVPPSKYYHGFLNKVEQVEGKDPDLVIYEIRKFFRLAADCNPSIIEVLWTDESEHIIVEDEFDGILEIRDKFLSKKARHTFSGYAVSQLKRIKLHRQWLLNPPTHQPTREEFGLSKDKKVSQSELGVAAAMYDSEDKMIDAGLPRELVTLYVKERAYNSASMHWDQYQNWLTNRNPARAKVEAKYGYDCKHAMHLVRLMRMCEEILTGKGVIVKRPDREELMAVRNGEWKYDDLLQWSEDMDFKMHELYETSTLPHCPNKELLDSACQKIVESVV